MFRFIKGLLLLPVIVFMMFMTFGYLGYKILDDFWARTGFGESLD